MHDLIFLSLEDWDEIWRRNQFLCATLARRHPEMKILFVGIPRNTVRHLRALDPMPLVKNPTWRVPNLPNITVTTPIRLGPESTEWGLKLNQQLYRRHVHALSHQLHLRDPILWVNPHSAFHLVGHMPHSAVIYDITDDWTSLSQKDLDRVRTVDADRMMCQLSDAVIVCSQRLLEMKREMVPEERLALIPNGVDADHYATVSQEGDIPAEIRNLKKPIFGYTGTVHPDRVDVNLIAQTAARIDGSFVLVGPNHLLPEHKAMLAATGKVHLLPAAPYGQIPDYMRAFDVCITPHKITPFTESLNPIKLFEYLAAGKPIVSTPVAGFRDHPEHVRLATTPEEFAHALQDALIETQSPQAQTRSYARQAEARKHSWDSRADHAEAVIARALTHPSLHKGGLPLVAHA